MGGDGPEGQTDSFPADPVRVPAPRAAVQAGRARALRAVPGLVPVPALRQGAAERGSRCPAAQAARSGR